MRRRLIELSRASLLLAAVATHTQANPGVALRWNHCYGEGTGQMIRSFACDTNAGFEELVGSFVLPTDLDHVTGNEIVVDVQTGIPYAYATFIAPPPDLPEWWRFMNAGSCRQNSLVLAPSPDPESQACPDWASGQTFEFIGAYRVGTHGPGTARVSVLKVVPRTAEQRLAGGTEYYSFTLRILHDRTVGDGSCAGCNVLMTLIFNSVNVTTDGNVNNTMLVGPLDGLVSYFATWRPITVPVRATSWAELRSRYR